jgi:hypothetical protein
MFDTAFTGDDTSIGHRPRERCSVFVDAIAALRSGDDYFKQLGFTTAHELGHPKNSAQNCQDAILPKREAANGGVGDA